MSLKDFKVKKFIGKGTYGTVYKVVRNSDGLTYALKEINIKYMSQKEREEAVNEIRLLASIRHPYIISYCAAFVENDKLYIVTDYAGAGDLYDAIKKRKARDQHFPEELIWTYLIQLCQGLKALHDQNILHRDLKSPNIFLASEDAIKIGDLGVAKLIKSDSKIARTQIGTPYYLSPEIWRNRPYNNKSDVWSLGVILYELMALRLPFEAQTPDQLARRVLRGEFAPPPSHYSKELCSIVTRMLVVDPDKRISLDEVLRTPSLMAHMRTPQKRIESHHKFEMYRTIKVPKQLSQIMLPSPKYPVTSRGEPAGSGLVKLPRIEDRRASVDKENAGKPFPEVGLRAKFDEYAAAAAAPPLPPDVGPVVPAVGAAAAPAAVAAAPVPRRALAPLPHGPGLGAAPAAAAAAAAAVPVPGAGAALPPRPPAGPVPGRPRVGAFGAAAAPAGLPSHRAGLPPALRMFY